jgi:membrane-associated phospholipid phosphatase
LPFQILYTEIQCNLQVFLDSQKHRATAILIEALVALSADVVSRLDGHMRLPRQNFPFVCLLFLLGWLITPILRCQESAYQQDAEADSSVTETSQEMHGPNETAVADEPNPEPTPDNPNPAAADQPVTWKNLPGRILGDQKLIWLFPLHVAQGQHLLPTIGVGGVTGGLMAADPAVMVHLRNTTAFDEFDEIFSGTNTGVVTALIPVTFYFYGLARKSSYSEQTALLAGEAYLDSAIPEVAMKIVSRRFRPSALPPTSDYTDTFFRAHVSVFGKGSSFPSGHAAGIFSVATVIAERYRKHRWVPWVMYGLAGAISFSRVPTFAHFPSDVFLGAALGYTITRFDVLRDRKH